MQPWVSSKRFDVIRADIEELTNALQKYRKHLVLQCKKAKSCQQSFEPSSMEDNASLVTLHPRGTGSTSSEYDDVQQRWLNLPLYQLLFLNDSAPNDRFER